MSTPSDSGSAEPVDPPAPDLPDTVGPPPPVQPPHGEWQWVQVPVAGYGQPPPYGQPFPTGYGSLPGSGRPAKHLTGYDLAVIALGVVAFIASFMPYVGVSLFGFSVHIDAWHSYATLGLLCLFGAAAAAAVGIASSATSPTSRIAFDAGATGFALIGTGLLLVRGLTYGNQVHMQWGGWLLVVVGLGQFCFAGIGVVISAARRTKVQPTSWGNVPPTGPGVAPL